LVKKNVHSTLEGLPRSEHLECGHWINHWGGHGVIHWNSPGTHRIDAVIADADSLEKERESQSNDCCHYTFEHSNGNCSLHPTTAALHHKSHIAAADIAQWVVVAAASVLELEFGESVGTASDGHGQDYDSGHGLGGTNAIVVVAVNWTVPALAFAFAFAAAVASAAVVVVGEEGYSPQSMHSMHWNS
jgi:hypothetical protein